MKYILSIWCICFIQNVAAVTSTSTRTPIYKAYAKGENIGDVTAKGESVGNIADLVIVQYFQTYAAAMYYFHTIILYCGFSSVQFLFFFNL